MKYTHFLMQLFNLISRIRVAAFTVSLLTVAALGNAVLAFVIQIILASNLSPTSFGIFASTFATITIVSPIASFGVAQFWLKQYGKEGSFFRGWLRSSYILIILTSLISVISLLAWANFGDNKDTIRPLLWILSICVFGQVSIELIGAKYQIMRKFERLAIISTLQNVMRLTILLGILFFISGSLKIQQIAIAYSITSIIMCMLAVFSMSKFSQWLRADQTNTAEITKESREATSISQAFKASWPFALAAFFQIVYYQIDVVMLKYMASSEQAGYYSVAFVIIAATYIFPNIVFQKYLLPRIHQWAYGDKNMLVKVFKIGNVTMFIIGTLALMFVWLFCSPLILRIFGTDYEASIKLLKTLAFAIPFIYTAYSSGVILTTEENMKTKALIMGGVALFNILANLYMIPLYGANGAAITTVVSAMALMGLYYVSAQKVIIQQVNSATSVLPTKRAKNRRS